jgi:hypothetical protein
MIVTSPVMECGRRTPSVTLKRKPLSPVHTRPQSAMFNTPDVGRNFTKTLLQNSHLFRSKQASQRPKSGCSNFSRAQQYIRKRNKTETSYMKMIDDMQIDKSQMRDVSHENFLTETEPKNQMNQGAKFLVKTFFQPN